jgi:DNA-binding transcriptional ArsR family regulator
VDRSHAGAGGGAPRAAGGAGGATGAAVGATGVAPSQAVFAALSDPTRRAVLLAVAAGEASTATELAAQLPISRQAVAKHLAQLREANLVDAHRSGRETRFEATPAPLADAIGWMTDVGAQWDDRLAALRQAVGES